MTISKCGVIERLIQNRGVIEKAILLYPEISSSVRGTFGKREIAVLLRNALSSRLSMILFSFVFYCGVAYLG